MRMHPPPSSATKPSLNGSSLAACVLHSVTQPPTDDGALATPGSALSAQQPCCVTRSTALWRRFVQCCPCHHRRSRLPCHGADCLARVNGVGPFTQEPTHGNPRATGLLLSFAQ